MNSQPTLAILSMLLGIVSLLCLVALHLASPEFQPSWRMISEYALGRHRWLITTFFILWGLSTACLGILLITQVQGFWANVGVALLIISAAGATMGGLFDIKHNLHGLSFMLGVPSLPVAALILGYFFIRHGAGSSMMIASHLPWISLVLMGVAMVVMMTGFKNAGIPMGPGATPPDRVPDGVIALAGYANRLLVASYIGWVLVVANYLYQFK